MVMLRRSVNLTTLFSKANLVAVNQYTVHILLFITDKAHFGMNQQKEEKDHRKYFQINLYESMGTRRDQTHNPWISYVTCYQLHYGAQLHSVLYGLFTLNKTDIMSVLIWAPYQVA